MQAAQSSPLKKTSTAIHQGNEDCLVFQLIAAELLSVLFRDRTLWPGLLGLTISLREYTMMNHIVVNSISSLINENVT